MTSFDIVATESHAQSSFCWGLPCEQFLCRFAKKNDETVVLCGAPHALQNRGGLRPLDRDSAWQGRTEAEAMASSTASTQRRGSVQAPVSPSRASQSILRCGQLKAQFTLQLSWYQTACWNMLVYAVLNPIQHHWSLLNISQLPAKTKREKRTLSEYLIVNLLSCGIIYRKLC